MRRSAGIDSPAASGCAGKRSQRDLPGPAPRSRAQRDIDSCADMSQPIKSRGTDADDKGIVLCVAIGQVVVDILRIKDIQFFSGTEVSIGSFSDRLKSFTT